MAVVSRYNSKQLYFPETLLEKLDTIKREALTIVEAPLGYGKTTALHHYLEESDLLYVWINVEKREKYHFFDDFCAGIRLLDEYTANELKLCGYPVDEAICDKEVTILKEIGIKDKAVIVIDNFQNISDEMICKMIFDIADIYNTKLHVVVLTQSLNTKMLSDRVYKEEVNYISKGDFEFSTEEITRYYRKCGIRLTDEEADYLQRYTDGWISAIYLQLLHYIENNSFEPDIGINPLISEMFWDKLTIKQQDLLIRLGMFENFTLRQALMLGDNQLSEQEIRDILGSNQLIHYESKQRKYYLHSLLRYFLELERNNLEPIFQKNIYAETGNWYAGNGEYGKAIKAFYQIQKYESVYSLDFKVSDIEDQINNSNKKMFLEIVRNTDNNVKSENIETGMVMCMVLYMYHEMDFFEEERRIIEKCIDENTSINMKTRQRYNGLMEMLMAVGSYNRLDIMNEHYVKACDLTKIPDNVISSGFSWTFKTPSVLFNIYRKDEYLNELLGKFENMAPYYYRLTGGNGKGSEALMKAEILLNRMDFSGAEVLCHKALYMAETREQFGVYAGAMFALARISVYRGDFENLKYIFKTMRKKMEETQKYNENIIIDMAQAYINLLVGRVKEIPGWLKDNNSIEKKCTIYNISFANLIYGRFLIESKENVMFSGISGQMLGAAGIYNNALYMIYLYIYISISNRELGQLDRAETFIGEAITLAKKDDIIIPFVENIQLLKEILSLDKIKNDEFVQKIFEFGELYGSRFQVVQKNDYGMTKREHEIAKMAAERYTNKEIALKLHISENTVKSNLKNVYGKLGISTRAELGQYILKN